MSAPPRSPGATLRLDEGARGALRLELDVVRVEVLEGPDRGAREAFALPVVRLGTDPANDLVLSDPACSRRHAELAVEGEALVLRDLDSTNGTFVGDARVREVELGEDAEVRLGESRLRVRLGSERRRAMPAKDGRLGEMVGACDAMQALFARIEAAAPTPISVLVVAESGCGKELVARTLHERSGREGPLVVFDAATADPAMVRADLFGHVKGAFTGAEAARPGAFRAAEGGTLFLDELGELPLDLQPRLLRALESRTVTPVGSDVPIPVDVRVVAATHRDIGAMVADGRFRADLYHRLSVLPLTIPPLRERAGDLPLLIERMSRELPAPLELGPEAMAALRAHPWPGNVRELRNVLERAAVLCAGRPATPADLMLGGVGGAGAGTTGGEGGARGGPGEAGAGGGEARLLADVEREAILAALARNEGNKTATARELGIGINTLRRKLAAYGVE